jgi:MerR family transcriptional regulator, heat shock protein HspR
VTSAGRVGGGRSRRAVPSRASWSERLDDADEPLFTLAVTADLLSIDTQTLRRLESAAGLTSERPSGNQRRYSRNDIERLARATELNREGTPATAIGRILDLEQQVADLRSGHRS